MIKYSMLKKIFTIILILLVYSNYSMTCFDLKNNRTYKLNNKYYIKIGERNLTGIPSTYSINFEYSENSKVIVGNYIYRLIKCKFNHYRYERVTSSYLFFGSHVLNLDTITNVEENLV